MEEIAKILRKGMIDKGVETAQELAGLTGFHRDTITRLLKGEESAKMITVLKCADVLGLRIKFVAKGE